MTHLHTLGWTSDNGPNLFAIGWLALLTVEIIVPRGGMDEQPISFTNRREEEEFVQLLLMFIMYIENEDD